MATVVIQTRKRANRNSYIITYKDPATGRRKYHKTYSRKKEAQNEANDLRTLLDAGQMKKVLKAKQKLSVATFNEVADKLEKAWDIKLKEGNLRKATFVGYIYILNLLRREFGHRPLFKFSLEDIQTYRIQLADRTTNVNSNRHLFVIKQVFKQSLNLGILTEDVSALIKKLPEKAQERSKFLIGDELRTLVECAKQTKAKHYLPAIIWLAADYGASRQEILDLKWNHIIFEKDSIKFFRTKNRKKRIFMDIGPESRKALLHWKRHISASRKKRKIPEIQDEYVFCQIKTGKRITSFNKGWQRAKAIMGLVDFHFHDLRHTFCSNLALAGASLKDIKDMIGHDDISMTDRYTHLTDNHRSQLQKLLTEQYKLS